MTEVENWREDTPGCLHSIHFNNAGAALMPQPVLNAIHDHLNLESNIGGYEAYEKSEQIISLFYEETAALIGAKSENIAFTSSATNSFAKALSCIPFKPGDKLLIANEDYISNQLAFLSIQKRFNVQLLRAPSLPEGGVDVEGFKKIAIQHRPVLASITHVPTNSGLIQPIEEIGAICRNLEIPFLLDACQSVGQLELDVKKIDCDFLSATFRKFLRGPRGAGFLYVNDRILKRNWFPLFVDMKGANWSDVDNFQLKPDATRFEDWELPYALVCGSRVASAYARNIGIARIQSRNNNLMQYLKKEVNAKGWRPLDRGSRTASIMTIYFPGVDPKKLHSHLKEKHINTSISLGNYAVIDFKSKNVDWALRISPHYYNTEQEINLLIEHLESATKI